MLFQLQLRIQLFGVARFLGIDLLGPGIEAAETDFRAPHRTAVEPQRLLGQPRKESPVVADDDKRAAETLQPFFDPLDGRDVEMVGRLVEQQHVRVLRKRPHDRRTPPFAARCLGRLAREVDAELIGNRFRLVPLWRVVARQDVVGERGEAGHRRFLLQQDDARSRHDRPSTLIRIDFRAQQLHQRRLASAIAPDQRQPVARTDMDVEPAKQPAVTLDNAEIFECEDWCSGHDEGRYCGAA